MSETSIGIILIPYLKMINVISLHINIDIYFINEMYSSGLTMFPLEAKDNGAKAPTPSIRSTLSELIVRLFKRLPKH